MGAQGFGVCLLDGSVHVFGLAGAFLVNATPLSVSTMQIWSGKA